MSDDDGRFYVSGLRYPRQGSPVDLGERLLAELSRLFVLESDEKEREAISEYMAGRWAAGARAELDAEGLRFDSKEIAYFGCLVQRRRLADRERNLMPWERLREYKRRGGQ